MPIALAQQRQPLVVYGRCTVCIHWLSLRCCFSRRLCWCRRLHCSGSGRVRVDCCSSCWCSGAHPGLVVGRALGLQAVLVQGHNVPNRVRGLPPNGPPALLISANTLSTIAVARPLLEVPPLPMPVCMTATVLSTSRRKRWRWRRIRV